MSALKWLADRAGNPITILSTELDGVPNGGTVLSGPIENSVSQDLYADFALTVGFQSAPSFGYGIELYIVRSLDGVVFDDTTGNAPPMAGYGDIFPVRSQMNSQTIIVPMIELPPTTFKILIKNNTGQAMALTNNVLKGFFYKRAVV